MVILLCYHQWRLSLVVLQVWVRSLIKQELHHIKVTHIRSLVQCSSSSVIDAHLKSVLRIIIHIRPMSKQQLHHLEAAGSRRFSHECLGR